MSCDLANQRDYLDQLFRVYPTIPDVVRDIGVAQWERVEHALQSHDDAALLNAALELPLFPIKDSYISYLRKDRPAMGRNPETVRRIAARLRAMGADEIYRAASQPKETNRQIGPMFKEWVRKRTITSNIVTDEQAFTQSTGNAILDGSDESCKILLASIWAINGIKELTCWRNSTDNMLSVKPNFSRTSEGIKTPNLMMRCLY